MPTVIFRIVIFRHHSSHHLPKQFSYHLGSIGSINSLAEYGGSLENRIRFSIEVLEEIRRQVGDDYIVGIRMMFDEALDGGLQFDEGIRIGELLADTGMIDFFNINRGHCSTSVGLAGLIPNMGTPQAPHLQFAAEVKRHFDLPVMHAARINDVATARYAIKEGLLDLVSMTAPTLRIRISLPRSRVVKRIRSVPVSVWVTASTGFMVKARPYAHITRRPAAKPLCRMSSEKQLSTLETSLLWEPARQALKRPA